MKLCNKVRFRKIPLIQWIVCFLFRKSKIRCFIVEGGVFSVESHNPPPVEAPLKKEIAEYFKINVEDLEKLKIWNIITHNNEICNLFENKAKKTYKIIY